MHNIEQRARLAREVLQNPLFQEVAARLRERATAAFWATLPGDVEGLRMARLKGDAVDQVVREFQTELDQELIEQKKGRHRHGKGD